MLTRVIDHLGDSTKDGQTMTVLGMIASGSLIFSPSPKAALGAVGVRMRSHFSKASAKSRLISARTFCALVK